MQHLEPKIDAHRIYTPDDAGEVFRVPAGTIRRLCRQGAISGFHVGSNIRMMGTALLEFIGGGGARVQYGPGETPEPDETEPARNPAEISTKITTDAPALADNHAEPETAAA